jgi:hypothetical protein
VPSAKYRMLGLIDPAGSDLQAKTGSLSALKVTGMGRGGDVVSTPARLLCPACCQGENQTSQMAGANCPSGATYARVDARACEPKINESALGKRQICTLLMSKNP